MSDDIDIEEHDVLDSPWIKKIFPDITSIKTEAIDYEAIYEDGDLCPENMQGLSYPVNKHPGLKNEVNDRLIDAENNTPRTDSFSDLQKDGTLKYPQIDAVSGGLKKEILKYPKIDSVSGGRSDENLSYPPINSNYGILGNQILNYSPLNSFDGIKNDQIASNLKINTSQNEENFLHVSQDDIPNFFQDVNLLNASQSEIQNIYIDKDIDNDFQQITNSLQELPMEQDNEVQMDYRNTIILGSKPCLSNFQTSGEEDSEMDSDAEIMPLTVSLIDWGVLLEKNPMFCAECKTLFPTQNAIDAHKMSAHSYLVAVSKNIAVKSTAKLNETVQNLDTNRKLVCFHCDNYFPDDDSFLKHTYELIPHKFSPTDKKKDKHTVCNTLEKKNRFTMFNVPPKMGPFNQSAIKPTYAQQIDPIHKTSIKKVSKDKFECLECNVTFPSAYSEKIHRAAKHSLEDIKSNPLSRPVPKSTLFKCYKCPIHFIFCSVALAHTKHCSLTRGDWKCPKCRRCFKVHDRIVHTQQHEITDRFKVYVVNPDLLQKIICKCLNCNICFDENTFIKTHGFGCIKTEYVECDICHLNIYETSLTKHKAVHNSVVTIDFIITEFVCSKTKNSTHTNPTNKTYSQTHSLKEKINSKKDKFSFKIHVAYCSFCKCCMKKTKLSYHTSGTCKGKPKRICKLCGLVFTMKAFVSHKNDHDTKGLKLSDLKFYHIQKNKYINPPIPEFRFCARCKVHFFSDTALTKHTCDSEDHKTCGFCNKKFSDLALKLHLPFHEYALSSEIVESKVNTCKIVNTKSKTDSQPTIPELLKKYQSLQTMWDILYLCACCDIAFDNYDTVVEHCQDHFNNLQSYNQTIVFCSICDLKMISVCFNKHIKLHENNIDISAFKIIKFDYQQLLTYDWMNIFGSLAEDRVKQILSKSIYNVTRNIRMELAVDGPVDLTLYQCKVCNVIIEPTDVLDHANRLECPKKYVTYRCSVCHIDFMSENSLSEHKHLHKTRKVIKGSFRIILFGNKKDFFNNTLLKHMKNNDLKFIRCHYCGKLIKKSLYKAHIVKHVSLQKIKNGKLKNQNTLKSKIAVNKTDKFLLELYKCTKCETCVIRKQVCRHKCVESSHLKRCNKCRNMLHTTAYRRHCMLHVTHKNLKVLVYLFKDNIIEKDINGQCIEATTSKNTTTLLKVPTISKSGNTILFYQCGKCNSSIKHKENVKQHKCSSKLGTIKCDKCGLSFGENRISEHYKSHKLHPYSKKDIKIITFIRNKMGEIKYNIPRGTVKQNHLKKSEIKLLKPISPDSELKVSQSFKISKVKYHLKLFRCYKCSVLFTARKLLILHVQNCSGEIKGENCPMCNIMLHESVYKSHLTTARCMEGKYNYVNLYAILDIRNDDTDNDNNWLYCCYECQVYFFNYKTYVYHVDIGHKAKISWCDVCNINFASGFEHHRLIHHKMDNPLMNINVEILHTTDPYEPVDHSSKVVDRTKQRRLGKFSKSKKINSISGIDFVESSYKIKNNPEISLGKNDISTQLTKQKMPCVKAKQFMNPPRKFCLDNDARKLPNYGNVLYRCHVCDLHFVNHRTLEKHVVQNKQHFIRRFHCPDCNLPFTLKSLGKHKITHRQFKEFTIMTLDEIITFQNRPKNNSIHFGKSDDSFDKGHGMDTQFTEQQIEEIKERQLKEPPRKCLNRNTIQFPQQGNIVYRCHVCDLHFINYHILESHVLQNNQHFTPRRACPECNLSFTPLILKKHRKIHKECKKCTVMTFDELAHIINNTHENSSKKNSINVEESLDNLEKDNIKEIKLTDSQILEIKKKQLMEAPRQYDFSKMIRIPQQKNVLYRCHVCDLHFVDYCSLEYHVKQNKEHFIPRISCPECNLPFTSLTLQKHRIIHQIYETCTVMTLDEMISFSMRYSKDVKETDDNLNEIKFTEQQIKVITEKQLMEPHRKYIDSKTLKLPQQKNTVYRCHICDLHFVNHHTLQIHVIQNKQHFIKRFSCPECNLPFTSQVLRKHIIIHQKYKECLIMTLDDLTAFQKSTNNMDFENIDGNSKEVTTNETQQNEIEELEMIDCANVSTYCDSMISSGNNAKVSTYCDNVISSGSNGSGTESSLTNLKNEPETIKVEENMAKSLKRENRLFKCYECDIYYLTAEACNDHCYNHAVLDPTEYIACKICDLQFLCESLGKHMKEHRDRTFNIDNLIVTEYRLSENDVKVVTYSAADALKSKQVTTTTHSDIE